jgi:hypothetical protein
MSDILTGTIDGDGEIVLDATHIAGVRFNLRRVTSVLADLDTVLKGVEERAFTRRERLLREAALDEAEAHTPAIVGVETARTYFAAILQLIADVDVVLGPHAQHR